MVQAKLCYYNGHWNIYLYTTIGYNRWMDDYSTETKRVEDKEYRLRTYPQLAALGIPAQSFGCMMDDPKQRPGHGGEWSSNSSMVNPVFGVELYEVAIDQIGVAVPFTWLKELLGDKVIWQADDIWREKIVGIVGHENKYMSWVTVKEFDTELVS